MEATLTAAPIHTIVVRSDLYDTLLRIAVREGKNVETIADEILTFTTRYDAPSVSATNKSETLMEILAPFQEAFDATGMTDEELKDFIDREIADHRREKAEAGD